MRSATSPAKVQRIQENGPELAVLSERYTDAVRQSEEWTEG